MICTAMTAICEWHLLRKAADLRWRCNKAKIEIAVIIKQSMIDESWAAVSYSSLQVSASRLLQRYLTVCSDAAVGRRKHVAGRIIV